MSYIYITGWDKFQHYKNRRPPWIKLYTDLLANDAWIALTPADAKLLQGLWLLAAMYGNGRLKAGKGQERSLTVQLGARKGSLERLEQAGFIEVRASKALADLSPREQRTETEKELLDVSRNRSSRAEGTAPIDQPTEPRPELPKALKRILDEQILEDLTSDQCALVARAWFHGVELRHSLASVESAENPVAMLVSISRRITNQEEPAA